MTTKLDTIRNSISVQDIENQVRTRMVELGIPPAGSEPIHIDNKPHRYRVEGDKSGTKNGFYLIYSDGRPAGKLGSWKHDISENWMFDASGLPDDIRVRIRKWEGSTEFKHLQEEREKEFRKLKDEGTQKARGVFDAAPEAQEDHPYLVRKHVPSYGVRELDGALLVPLYDENGEFKTYQTIKPNGWKGFCPDAPMSGNFFSIGGDIQDGPVLLCEGYSTGATLHELTGHTVICCMNAGNLVNVAPKIRKLHPKRKILIAADNDAQQKGNPGLAKAQQAVKEAKLDGLFYPEFPEGAEGTDWNDYAAAFGSEKAEKIVREHIKRECETQAERKAEDMQNKLLSLRKTLDPDVQVPPVEMVGGLFPKGYLSAIIAGSGVGKTWLIQRLVSDLSVGGPIFDGFAYSEPIKTLMLAGEAGYELLIRRSHEVQWQVNKENAVIYSVIDSALEGISFDIGTDEGQENVKGVLDLDKPEVLLIDTLSAVHHRDENKSAEMKPIFDFLLMLAKDRNIAVIVSHHTRKRKLSEARLMMSQDEAVGSNIFNRYAAAMIGVQSVASMSGDGSLSPEAMGVPKMKNLVRIQKAWYKNPAPFVYELTEDEFGRTFMTVDLAPKVEGDTRSRILDYIEQTYSLNDWFKSKDISDVMKIPDRTVRSCLSDFANKKILQKRGSTRSTEYCLQGTYAQKIKALTDD